MCWFKQQHSVMSTQNKKRTNSYERLFVRFSSTLLLKLPQGLHAGRRQGEHSALQLTGQHYQLHKLIFSRLSFQSIWCCCDDTLSAAVSVCSHHCSFRNASCDTAKCVMLKLAKQQQNR